jgi:hypothetical protein
MRHGTWQAWLVQLAIAAAVAGCDSDETSDGSAGAGGDAATGSPSGATTGAGGGNGGNGGNGGQADGGQGGGGECLSCKQTVEQNAPPTAACAGESATLVGTLVTCLCQEDVCGGPDKGCNAACTMGVTPDEACLACDQEAAMGPCMTEFAACFADE